MEVSVDDRTIIINDLGREERMFYLTLSEAKNLWNALDSAIIFLEAPSFKPITFYTIDAIGGQYHNEA